MAEKLKASSKSVKTKKVSGPKDKPAELQEKMSKKTKQDQTKKERKAAYRRLKEQVVEFEHTNYRYVVLIREGNSVWWKAFGHSAVILSALIGPRLKRKFKLHPDTDFGAEKNDKVVIVQSIGALRAELKTLRIYPTVEKETSIRFELDEPVTHEVYQDAAGLEERQRELANKVFIPKHLVPVLDDEIRKLQRHVRILTASMKSPERDAYGTDMRKVVVEMKRLTVRLAQNRISFDDFLEREMGLLLDLDEFANVVMDDEPCDVVRMAKFGEQYMRVEAEIENELRRKVAKEAEEKMRGKAEDSARRLKKKEIK
ncbi:hypothetical protein IJ114_02810 [Candidatus Saccharibacteria bacterium]|nr:hypothetical protein [Candidatus Saccharibacteria bacterium]